jgi:hypothetical protein
MYVSQYSVCESATVCQSNDSWFAQRVLGHVVTIDLHTFCCEAQSVAVLSPKLIHTSMVTTCLSGRCANQLLLDCHRHSVCGSPTAAALHNGY